MSFDTPVSSPAEAETEAPKKSGTTKAAVVALFSEFEPKAAPEATPAEKERTKRVGQLDAQIRRLAVDLRNLGIEDAKDLAAAERAGKSLLAAAKSARTAIESIPDGKLVPAEKAPAKPRTSTTRTLSESDAQAAVARQADPTPEPEAAPEPEAQEPEAEESTAEPEPEEEPHQEEAATAAPQQHRSGPASRQAPRGDTDPNAGDGF